MRCGDGLWTLLEAQKVQLGFEALESRESLGIQMSMDWSMDQKPPMRELLV